ncbi:MAG: 16S rRNA (cytidine(1402)-2'-O)-methyltransferase [Deltaproteobacteria bacterium]|nr:16S rRNA (cytidine(1402)-2'-O)-methyltransferase [Myxococcales bacterium]MCZ6568957.1 16S rRNA (cytidine(1402)-2'-O)-methyltransferase [Deltaproteobacteria bacterium]MCZ6713585.1 16S rRNA (cytidine(1402)-2'-O)-methyltransferase [Deltaproteobacteria bacterium]TDI95167.1 MAG: 16S rRNA (cytidine(1402)-2'-O)-methyltransferase [Deltaproteobacteria bacterium]TDJ09645.1 MAG: 16S rRNA (cytidine(1402)-2'-O)-methyltransferase [Deltaproteobacteria bacterium]
MTVPEPAGCVYVVSTPIGNLEDLSPRALRSLREASLVVCEDTRRTARLCARFGITTRRISLHAHNETRRTPELLRRLERGETLALVSDAGTPLLSDPGARFVHAALEQGLRVVPVPGPSAVLAALVASGLPTRPFTFVGFLPRKGRERAEWLERLRESPGTLVLFEAPNRVRTTLRDLYQALGPRRVTLARELTKRFEEIVRGRLGELELPALRGEVTLVVAGNAAAFTRSRQADAAAGEDDWLGQRIAAGGTTRDISRELAQRLGISRSHAYRRVLAYRKAAAQDSGARER